MPVFYQVTPASGSLPRGWISADPSRSRGAAAHPFGSQEELSLTQGRLQNPTPVWALQRLPWSEWVLQRKES